MAAAKRAPAVRRRALTALKLAGQALPLVHAAPAIIALLGHAQLAYKGFTKQTLAMACVMHVLNI
jgi:hypothetical protein